jgi:hypothetical protein
MNENTDPEYQEGNNATVVITIVVVGAVVGCMILVAVATALRAWGVL